MDFLEPFLRQRGAVLRCLDLHILRRCLQKAAQTQTPCPGNPSVPGHLARCAAVFGGVGCGTAERVDMACYAYALHCMDGRELRALCRNFAVLSGVLRPRTSWTSSDALDDIRTLAPGEGGALRLVEMLRYWAHVPRSPLQHCSPAHPSPYT
jgi:hypothetical protein